MGLECQDQSSFVCFDCKKDEPLTTHNLVCDCGGLFQLKYEAPLFSEALIDQRAPGQFRYHRFMPLLDDSWRQVTMGEGMTPIISLDKDVLLKMDYMMPTLSFKDRGVAVLMSHCKSIGVRSVVQDSSGNAGHSVAAYAARAGIECDIYVPETTSPKKMDLIRAHGARLHIVPGSRDTCAAVCREAVASRYYASHVFNPLFYQGTKTYVYEIYEQLGRIPLHLFVPLGNGTLLIGVLKGLEELRASGVMSDMPQVLAVQSQHCDPLFQAVAQRSPDPVKTEVKPTLAEGIAIGVPARGREILHLIAKHKVKVITAPEDRILEAREALAKRGIYCEHTTAASYAAYLEYCDTHGPTPDSLLPMCGAGLKSDH
eukprot:Blabericola_migrator_1__7989@NODE_40_length_17295_cov_124_751393_g36_i0_p5_GENE_NODE_40_length_17295_cov_124_751393_g36_i0NODE_40_length_17295_cov_124_751393_g36_i0_p5_ORF_typecomplete_len371_score60_58PALP/PF00291_25/1_3e57_NODE_40_length_17295_cov_124_751393_g36_i031274239